MANESPFVVPTELAKRHDNYKRSRDMSQQHQEDDHDGDDDGDQVMVEGSRVQHNIIRNQMLMAKTLTSIWKYFEKLNQKLLLAEEEQPKRPKKKLRTDHLLVEDDDCLIYRYELLCISTFLMTDVGLKHVLMLDFNGSWVIVINAASLAVEISQLMKTGKDLAHMKRRRLNKNGTKPLAVYSKPSVIDILKYQLPCLGLHQYKSSIEARWPNVKLNNVVIFNGASWIKRWKDLTISNPQDVKFWYNDLSTWEHEEIEMSETQKRGWLTCHKYIPNGLYDLPDEDDVIDSDNLSITTEIEINFGWHVIVPKE